MNIETQYHCRLERTIKEFSQFDNKKPDDLESEFVMMVKTSIHDVNAKCAADTYLKFLL